MCRFIVSLVTVAAFLVPGRDPQADETAAYTVLHDGAAELREDFNRAKGSVRSGRRRNSGRILTCVTIGIRAVPSDGSSRRPWAWMTARESLYTRGTCG
jgi:hypothetical protein